MGQRRTLSAYFAAPVELAMALFAADIETLSPKHALTFACAFAAAWLAWLIPMAHACATALESARVIVFWTCASFIGVFPCIAVLARLRWMMLRRGADAGVARARSGAPDPLRGASVGTTPNAGTTPKRRVCVVGCGASGIVAMRHAIDAGFDVVAYEKSDSIGGVWAFSHPSSKVFRSVLQNCTKMNQAFADLRMPSEFPAYVGWAHTMRYFQMYCEKFRLGQYVRLCHEVERVRALDDGSGFEVSISSSSSAPGKRCKSVERFDFVWVCSGQLTAANVPDVQGLNTFPGKVIHSEKYTRACEFADQRVLVVGLGSASGSDIAQELADIAISTALSIRTERWLLGRGIIQGTSTMVNWFSALCPAWFGVVWSLYSDWYGFIHNMKPAVTDSGDLLKAIALQKIRRVNIIDHIHGSEVTFVDGQTAHFDAIIFATGYKREFKFMPDELKPTTSGLFEHCVLPHEPRVAYILFVLPFGTHWQLAELQAMFVARAHAGVIPLPSIGTMRELAESFEIVGHHEHLSEFYRMLYLAILAPYIFPSVKTLLTQPKTLARLLWSPYNAPIGDWISEDPNRTRYADVLRLYFIGSGWTSTRLNRW